jgi:hypothetical protein
MFQRLSLAARWVRGLCARLRTARPDASEARGLKLLKEWLPPEQLAQYTANGFFDVIGCHSGRRYRIHHGAAMNVVEVDEFGGARAGWCFMPRACLVAGDVMLAQKIALETNERGTLAIANNFTPDTRPHPSRRGQRIGTQLLR